MRLKICARRCTISSAAVLGVPICVRDSFLPAFVLMLAEIASLSKVHFIGMYDSSCVRKVPTKMDFISLCCRLMERGEGGGRRRRLTASYDV